MVLEAQGISAKDGKGMTQLTQCFADEFRTGKSLQLTFRRPKDEGLRTSCGLQAVFLSWPKYKQIPQCHIRLREAEQLATSTPN